MVVAMRGCPSHVSCVMNSCTGLKLRSEDHRLSGANYSLIRHHHNIYLFSPSMPIFLTLPSNNRYPFLYALLYTKLYLPA